MHSSSVKTWASWGFPFTSAGSRVRLVFISVCNGNVPLELTFPNSRFVFLAFFVYHVEWGQLRIPGIYLVGALNITHV